MIYDKREVRESLTLENIFELLQDFGGEPEYTNFGIVSATICHNPPGEGSHKLWYYTNTGLFRCWTACGDAFDIFELVIKVKKIQENLDMDLNAAVVFTALKFGISGSTEKLETLSDDWKILNNYERIQELEVKDYKVQLKEYDNTILDRFNYDVKIKPWLDDGIGAEALLKAQIGYFPGGSQITIPHFDCNGRFIGLRGRTLIQEDAERFGKYRPMIINKIQYNHPLGMNLYNLNNSKDKIKLMQKAIIFESEKSCLQYQTLFGIDNDISVACCGSNISGYQIHFLIESGANEIIVALDRQFQSIGDNEYKQLTNKLIKLNDKYKNYVNLSFMFDKNMITGYKSSPTDEGKDKFLQLFKERIML